MAVKAFRKELGLMVRYHVPAVAAMGAVPVECEDGTEALFPFASKHIIVPRVHDDERRGRPRTDLPEKRFIPKPHVTQNVGGYDVVVCPRRRNYGPNRNWDAWPYVVDELKQAGCTVFAAGAPDSSYDVDCPKAWEYPRFLDASIEAMLSASLVLSIDSGLAHLAVLCGRPLLLVSYRGLCGPGPVLRFRGQAKWRQNQHPPVPWEEYFVKANHAGAHIEMMDGWEHPLRVVRRAVDLVFAPTWDKGVA